MGQTQVLEPVTRIEGHAKITIELDDGGEVEDTKFHVTEYRAFEKFVEGRVLWEMPDITSRICGICPVSHHLAAAKGCDALVGAEIPEAAHKLRELLHMGQVFQSHALSFFYLSSPELVLGFEADPAERNIVGVLKEEPQLASRGVKMRSFGQRIIEALGGKRVHPDYAIPGGVNSNLGREKGEDLLQESKELIDPLLDTIEVLRGIYRELEDEVDRCAKFPTGYMGLVDDKGELELYDGRIRLVDEEGQLLEEVSPDSYDSIVAERSQDWSYLKFPYYRKAGFEEGIYRVGPLARLNVVEGIGTELAHREWEEYRKLGEDGILEGSLYYHYARLVEMLYNLERMVELLEDEKIYSGETAVNTAPTNERGVGVIEAPRGTLIHDYGANENGVIESANFIVATGHNNVAMNMAVNAVAKEFVDPSTNGEIPEGTLNRMESAIRCYDPCLSCSTHAMGQMPLKVELRSSQGELLDERAQS
ncbi:MAG: Ni/Fe hydrogenase subunit alpha [Candidatus Bipolaricaulota bacterium]